MVVGRLHRLENRVPAAAVEQVLDATPLLAGGEPEPHVGPACQARHGLQSAGIERIVIGGIAAHERVHASR